MRGSVVPGIQTGYRRPVRIDLNSDVGESFGAWTMGQDEALIPLVTSANVACGAHAGDPLVIERTVALAAASGVAVGAHPGYPDVAGFGRRDLDMSPAELEASVLYQIGAVAAFARAAGVALRHVKPHGAMYNRAATDPAIAEPIVRAVRRFSAELVVVALAGSPMLEVIRSAGLTARPEAFVDRAYESDGSLRSRRLPGAVHPDASTAAAQAVSIARDGTVMCPDGSTVEVRAETICLHGDTPDAPAFALAIRSALEAAGIGLSAERA